MVCSNCKSTDIVAIQGVNYCINCGQRVEQSAPTPKKAVGIRATQKPRAAARRAAIVQEAPQIKVRTKSKPAPVVEKSRLIINHPTVSAPKITVKAAATEEPVAAIPARASSKAAPLDLRSDDRKKVLDARKSMMSSSRRPATRLSDVRVSRPAAIKPKSVAPEAAVTAVPAATETIQKKTEKPNAVETSGRKVSSEGSALVYAWKQLGNWRYLALALAAGAFAGLPALVWRLNVSTVQLYDALLNNPLRLIGTDVLAQAVRFGTVWLGLGALVYSVHVLVANAITYGAARSIEARPVNWLKWIKAALATLPEVLRIDLLLFPAWLGLAFAEAYLVAGLAYSSMPLLQQTTILIVANVLVVYVALALIFTRLFGGYVVVLAGKGSLAAIAMGWGLFRKRTLALAVNGLIGGGVSALIYLPAMALNYANRDLPAEVSGMGQTLGAYGFATILWALSVVFVTTYFLKQYRRSVVAVYGQDRLSTLAATKTHKISPLSKLLLFGILLTGVSVMAIGYLYPESIKPAAEDAIRWLSNR